MEPHRQPAVSVSGLLQVFTTVVCFFTTTGFLGAEWWLFDITSHFRMQYLVLLILVAAASLGFRKRRLALVCVLFALLNLFAVRSLWWSSRATNKTNAESPPLRAVLLNVRTENEEKALVLTFLLASKADVIAILEANQAWAEALQPLRVAYPHLIAEPREDNFGLLLFSRNPIVTSQLIELGEAGVTTIEATLKIAGRDLKLFVTHPLPPGGREHTRLRDEQLRLLAERAASLAGPVLVLGDLNTSPWGSAFRTFRKVSGLTDTSEGIGWQATWPTSMPFMLIPLDHAFVSPDLHVIGRHIGPQVGSDHFPLLVDLTFRRNASLKIRAADASGSTSH